MTGTVGIIGGDDRQLEAWLRAAGLRCMPLRADELSAPVRGTTVLPDVVLVDVRAQRGLLGVIPTIKRSHPAIGIAIICSSLDPALMLEAMRAGVNECVPEPVTQESVESAISRLLQQAAPSGGSVFAIVGAKGGVGATTIAVNLAQALAQTSGEVLLIDLNLASGDTGTFFASEPRFTVIEALENTHRLDEAFFRSLIVRTSPSLDLLPVSPRVTPLAAPLDLQKVRTLIDFAVRYYRFVVLDVPRAESSLVDALDAAAGIFVVVNQELPTVRNAQSLVTRLRQRYGAERIGILVNRADRQSEIAAEDIQKALNARILFSFPSDYRQAIASLNKGQPLAKSNRGRLASSFHTFAQTLTGSGDTTKPEKATAPESSRIFGWLTPDRSTSE
ncbi:MAG: AAA family ATPase [Acidobacteriota bacterium]